MRLGDVVNAEAAHWGKPLAGVRILALEQMQALPYATPRPAWWPGRCPPTPRWWPTRTSR